jgi:hypothetical protein
VESPPPNWYPSPDADGMLRWWDGQRWTPNVQPAPAPGKVPLGVPVSEGGARITFTPAGEVPTHVYPPLSDPRYAGSPLAAAYLAEEELRDPGGDIQVPYEQQAAVEAAYQAKLRGGVVGALAASSEQATADALLRGLQPGAAVRGDASRAAGVLVGGAAIWNAVKGIGFGAVFTAFGLFFVHLAPTTPVVWVFPIAGVVFIVVSIRELISGIRQVRG